MANPAPVIGEWYRRTGGDSFEVVAIDPDDRTIEIQYFDGTIEETDLDEWLLRGRVVRNAGRPGPLLNQRPRSAGSSSGTPSSRIT